MFQSKYNIHSYLKVKKKSDKKTDKKDIQKFKVDKDIKPAPYKFIR